MDLSEPQMGELTNPYSRYANIANSVWNNEDEIWVELNPLVE